MQVTLLGTGSAFPSPTRVQSGLLVEHDENRMLVDCGSGVIHRLAQVGTDYRDVSTVLLSHHHLDHVADLPSLIKARILSDHPESTVIGPPGTSEMCDRLLAHDDLLTRGEITVREINPGSAFDACGWTIAPVRTDHTAASVAYRFDNQVVYSGDTAPSPSIFDLADGVHTLIHECALPDDESTSTHTSPRGLIDGLGSTDIERLVVTHLYPSMEREVEAVYERLQSALDPVVLIGEDRLQLGLPG